jgi:hypothetical protein
MVGCLHQGWREIKASNHAALTLREASPSRPRNTEAFCQSLVYMTDVLWQNIMQSIGRFCPQHLSTLLQG